MTRLLFPPLAALICTGFLFGGDASQRDTISKFLARTPLSFERNKGQAADHSAEWIGHANGYQLALNATGATIVALPLRHSDVVRMQLVDGRPEAASVAREPLPGKTSYLIGRDPKRWIHDLTTYARIEYREAYPGIDVAWYGNQDQLEYDFLLKPGTDPQRIRVRFEGARKLALEADGDIRIETTAGPMKLHVPKVYQDVAGTRKRVEGRYVLRAANEIAFDLAAYDKSKPLVIDPTLSYGTYFGGGLSITAIATDKTGDVYVGGTASFGVPVVNALQPGSAGSGDVWVAKFDSTGTMLLYSTYVGGSGSDSLVSGSNLAVDSAGELIATGNTYSTDFPLVNPVQSQAPSNGYCLPFAFKLNAAGNGFVYSTYLGGNPPDGATGWAVATDSAGDAYIAGEADGGFATTTGAYQTTYGGGFSDGFVVKLGPTGALLYATMIGGSGLDIANAIVADAKGNAYVAGYTGSTSFPKNPPGAVTHNAGGLDVFVAKLNPTGSKVNWLTFLGGTGDDAATALARDASSGELYVAGLTNSADFPTTAGVIQPAANGPEQGFIASISSNGTSFGFVTYLGGNKADAIYSVALTTSGLIVGGSTGSAGFPISNGLQPAFAGPATSLYGSTNSGASWTAADTGLPAPVMALTPDPTAPGAMLAVSDPTFSLWAVGAYEWFRTANGGSSWSRTGLALGGDGLWWYPDGAQIVRAPSNPAVLYTAYPFSVGMTNPAALTHVNSYLAFRSTDDGATWQALAAPSSSDTLAGIAVSPTNPDEIVEISQGGLVFQGTDGGASFTQLSPIPGGGASWGYPQTVAGSPDGSIYVGGCSLYKSTDFGSTWTTLPVGGCIGDVAVSPSNPSVVYAVNAWGGNTMDVYQSTNAGATWTQVTSPGIGDATGAVLVVAPSNPNVISVASGNQVAVSTNGGTTWSSPATLPSNIWAVGISSSNPAVVYAGTTATSDGFAAKLSTDGKTLLWSTFYSGDSGASVSTVAGSGSTRAWIAGQSSPGLPLTHNAYNSNAYGGTAFLARIADSTSACSYTVSPTSVTAYGSQTVYTTVTAPSGCTWTATPSGAWITIQSGSSGSGSGIVAASLGANSGKGPRTGSISVAGKTFTITEAPSSCTYSTSGNTNVPTTGGTVQLAVTAPTHCPWKAISESPYVSVTSGSSGSGNGTVTLSVAANNSVAWLSPTVQIGPTTVTLQEADTCSYSLSPQSLPDAAASGTMTVTANFAGCAWSPSSDASWLSVSGSGTGSGTFSYTVQENTTGAPRIADLTLDHQVFQVTQQP